MYAEQNLSSAVQPAALEILKVLGCVPITPPPPPPLHDIALLECSYKGQLQELHFNLEASQGFLTWYP